MSFSPTPMMAQWHSCKEKAGDALLFFRLGDFYEAFHDDAKLISQELGVVLTQRQTVPMCGVPAHVVEASIDKLVSKGYKVAVAEQTEAPSQAKGLVRRELTQIITPGTVVNSELIQEGKNNFIAAISERGNLFGLALLDLTTGEFFAMELPQVFDEVHRLQPAEFVISRSFKQTHPQFFRQLSLSYSFLVNEREDFELDRCRRALSRFSLDQFGSAAQQAAGTLLIYLKEDLSHQLPHVTQLINPMLRKTMALDRATLRNLELTEGSSKHTLMNLLDHTATSMGRRLLRNWVENPELSLEEIHARQNAIARFLDSYDWMKQLHQRLKLVRDLERLISKIATRRASPRDLAALGSSLAQIPFVDQSLGSDFEPLAQEILHSLKEELPLRIHEGGIFKDGIYPELDRLRALKAENVEWIARYQASLREQTGIKTLKVGYTRAFGYYIEVSRGKGELVPEGFQRRQTLVNAERFITEELKERETEVLSAEERTKSFEEEAFELLRSKCAERVEEVLALAKKIARMDVLLSLALVAKEQGFVRPTVDESDRIEIRNGRHPVIERAIGRNQFIPNDTSLDTGSRQLLLLTGPNMGGKSTYIRQVALIVIMAQMGSYVPADHAHIGLVDKLFSRIGASDDLARGQSTFMVEMSETANILNNATARSLILLDEIGRGTSTYDGIAIAWAVAEFILARRSKTLFATHYWELTRLPGAFNMHMAVQEADGKILFLHKIHSGAADRSYGIHVAKLAGLPQSVIVRAEELLKDLAKVSCS
jgi:DNA mismatch repair protein MutS